MKDIGWPFAIALLVLGGFCFAEALRIEDSALSGEHDPGPRALPLALSGLLLAGGVGSCLVRTIHWHRGQALATGATNADTIGFGYAPAALGAFVLYVAAIPWLGFQASTLAFVFGMLLWLGARWWSALLMALVVVGVVRFVFGNLFYVQLPEGSFGLAF